ncbi:hypothetical protein DFH06DRAFT_1119004 [Mycena polygramma]|nr:hypothetical protein DFH06DRAFT_1119004 [Mycena polygramma]
MAESKSKAEVGLVSSGGGKMWDDVRTMFADFLSSAATEGLRPNMERSIFDESVSHDPHSFLALNDVGAVKLGLDLTNVQASQWQRAKAKAGSVPAAATKTKSRRDRPGESRTHPMRSDPQLPRVLWERFQKDHPDSVIFSETFGDLRCRILMPQLNCISLEEGQIRFDDLFPPVVMISSSKKTDKETGNATTGGSWLHLAVAQGDLPLAHECIRLGTPIEHKDRRGYSALYFACSVLKDLLLPDRSVRVSFTLPPGRTRENFEHIFVSQIIQISLLLLEHRADPNEEHDGMSPLVLACLTDQWDLIQGLLLHGAHPSPSSLEPIRLPAQLLKTQRERDKFDAHVAQFSGKPRPRPRCPCGSGRALEDCHSKAHLKRGCALVVRAESRHDMYWVEVWDPRTVRLQRLCVPRMTQNPEIQKTAEDPATHVVDPDMRAKVLNWTQAILKGLAEHGEIDPAYAAAGFKLQTSPLYPKLVQSMSKMDVNDSTRMWNAAVDEYIACGVDPRPTEIIENAAKVGLAGGPLHRRCEAGGCLNLEYRKGVKLSLCSGCEKVHFSIRQQSLSLISKVRRFIAVTPAKKLLGERTGRRAALELSTSSSFLHKKPIPNS